MYTRKRALARHKTERHWSVLENSFPPSAPPTSRYTWAKFSQHSPLCLLHLAQVSHKVEGTSDGKQFSNTLQLEKTWLSAAVLYGFLRVHAPQTARSWLKLDCFLVSSWYAEDVSLAKVKNNGEPFYACQYSSGARPYFMRNASETSATSGVFHEFSVRCATGGAKCKWRWNMAGRNGKATIIW